MIRLCFLGADIFAVPVVESLIASRNIALELVITRPAKPAGRGLKPEPNPVLALTKRKNIPILYVDKNSDWRQTNNKLQKINPDLCVVAALGRIIPSETLQLFKNRFINIHPSLLPKYRGPSPIESSVLGNEKKTGVSFIVLSNRLDAGPIIAQEEIMMDNSNALELSRKLSLLASKHIAFILTKYQAGQLTTRPQHDAYATYTSIITKANGLVELSEKPEVINRKIRAFYPWPGVYFIIDHRQFKITASHLKNNQLVIDKIQPANKKIMTGREFINGYGPVLTKIPKSIIINPL
jgi:methionyl-tRNA formyltransferase